MRLDLATAVILAATGCAHAPPSATRITCYSGGKIILDDIAANAARTSTGWIEFESTTTGKRVRVAADCVVGG